MTALRIPGTVPTRPRPQWLAIDDLDTRRDLWDDLQFLHPVDRVRWLEWCCRHATLLGSPIRPTVGRKTHELLKTVLCEDSDYRLTWDVFRSFWDLSIQYELAPDAARTKMKEMLKRVPRLHRRGRWRTDR